MNQVETGGTSIQGKWSYGSAHVMGEKGLHCIFMDYTYLLQIFLLIKELENPRTLSFKSKYQTLTYEKRMGCLLYWMEAGQKMLPRL